MSFFKSSLLLCSVTLPMFGCASSMRMPSDCRVQGDSTQVGPVKVRVVDLEARTLRAEDLGKSPTIPPELLLPSDTTYHVGPLDALIITVWEHPELTQPLGQYRNDLASGQLVDPDGTFYFPYVGRMAVAGKTVTEIQKLVIAALSKVLRDPQVDIKIAAYRSKRIYVSGEVRNPGILAIDDVPMTLPEALNRVGNILPSGDASMVRLVRDGRVFQLDVEGLQKSGARIDNIRLHPGDQIRVPGTDESVAYILGEVNRPSVVNLRNGRTSLVRGLTEAGGYNDLTANAAGVYVVRSEDSSHVTVFRLDGRSPVALAWAGQFMLRPRDLVYIDQSGLSRWNKVFQLLVPMASVLSNATLAGENIRLMKTEPW